MHQRIPGGPTVLALALLTLFCVGLGYRAYNLQEEALVTQVQLTEERESSDNLRKISRETSSQLLTATQELLTARQDVVTARRQVGQLDRENGTLLSENTDLRNIVRTLEGLVNGLEAQNEELSGTLSSLEPQHQSLKDTLATAGAERQRLEADNTHLLTEQGRVEQELQDIRDTVDSVSSLEERIGELEADIVELESRRRALLVRSRTTDIRCTGSMEPALTCLDSVTILNNFRPEDIVVGSIISFYEEGDRDSSPFLHRVLERKFENGVYYYWPQGDATEEPDGYWVPEDWVEGYVTELHKNSHPENAERRNDVIAKKDEYDRAGTHYDAVVDEVCGDIGPDEICYTTDAEEDRLDSAYDAYLLAWCWYVAVLDAAELAGTGLTRALPYDCWGRL